MQVKLGTPDTKRPIHESEDGEVDKEGFWESDCGPVRMVIVNFDAESLSYEWKQTNQIKSRRQIVIVNPMYQL